MTSRVLIVDDDIRLLEGIAAPLQRASGGRGLERYTDPALALEATRTGHGVLVTDWQMGPLDGLELCHRIRAQEADAGERRWHIIVMTGRRLEDAAAALDAGADDFVTKPTPLAELNARIERGLSRLHELHALSEANEKLLAHTFIDPLTALPNRRHGQAQLFGELRRVAAGNQHLGAHLVDIDGFRAVNRRLGGAAGDALLSWVAQSLRKTCRDFDTVVRWDADAFLLLCPNADRRDTLQLAERLCAEIARAPVPVSDSIHLVTSASVGSASISPFANVSGQTLLSMITGALDEARASGRNQRRYFRPKPSSAGRVLELSAPSAVPAG